MCIYTHIHIYIYWSTVYINICTHAVSNCVWVLMYVCVHARMDGCVHILVRLHIHILDIYICIYIYIQGPNVLFSVYIIHIHICIYIYLCVYVYVYIYMYLLSRDLERPAWPADLLMLTSAWRSHRKRPIKSLDTEEVYGHKNLSLCDSCCFLLPS